MGIEDGKKGGRKEIEKELKRERDTHTKQVNQSNPSKSINGFRISSNKSNPSRPKVQTSDPEASTGPNRSRTNIGPWSIQRLD